MGLLESDTTEWLHFHFSLSCTGEGNGNPLQCSCLENPRDGGAWWAAVYGVAQSQTRLKRCSCSSSSSRFLIALLPMSKCLLILWLHSDFGAEENEIWHCFHIFPICHEVMGPDAMIFVLWMWVLSQLFHSPFTFIKRLVSSSSHFLPLKWYHLHIWDCWYFSWQSWFQFVLHSA